MQNSYSDSDANATIRAAFHIGNDSDHYKTHLADLWMNDMGLA
jgi:hypothetical protein